MTSLGSTLLLPALAALAGRAAPAAPQAPHDPRVEDGVVFVRDRCGEKEGAPPAKNLGKLVVLTDLDQRDPWRPLVERVMAVKKTAVLVPFPEGKLAKARATLERELPEFVLVVTKPEHLDVNFHFELLELLAALDDDPFVDAAPGYLTGATLDEAKAFFERIVALEAKKQPLPQELVDFGPIAQGPAQSGGPQSDPIGKGWKRWFAYHGPVSEMIEKKALLAGRGVLHAGGHGLPCGIDHGLQGVDLRKQAIDLGSALYFSGPCYCGVTSGWFAWGDGAIERRVVAPEESFALAAIARGVSALFAGFDPDRGETCSQEIEHLFVHGDALGHASKETYDGVVVARRQEKLELFRYEVGKPMPHQGMVDTMTGGGACRALFGDPSWRPIAACAEPLYEIKKRDSAKSLTLELAFDKPDLSRWELVDVYHCEGGWTHRLAFTIEIPLATAKALDGFEVKSLTAGGKPLVHHFPTAMVERFGGKAFLHVYVVFPPAGQQNTFTAEHDFAASFVLRKRT